MIIISEKKRGVITVIPPLLPSNSNRPYTESDLFSSHLRELDTHN